MKHRREYLKNITLIVIGTLLLAFGTAVFLLPNSLICGGVSGVAILLSGLFPVLSEDGWIALITIVLFLLGFLGLKGDFALKTLLSTAIYPLAIVIFGHVSGEDAIALLKENNTIGNLLFASMSGGVLIGVGCALTFLGGGSTGGVDILAFLLCKRFPNWRSSYVIFMIDAIIIFSGIVMYRDYVKSSLGILSAFLAAMTIDIIYHKKRKKSE